MIYEHTFLHQAECSAVFDQNGMTLCPTLPIHLILCPQQLFFFPWIKKVLKGKHFADAVEVKQKMAEAPKDFKIDKFKTRSERWKNHLVRCTASNGEYFEGNWSLNM